MTRKVTKNAKGSGNIRQRADGLWEARYTTGRDPGTGKQKQKSVYGHSQAEVRKKLHLACVAIDEGIYCEPSKLSFGDWLEIWLSEYTSNLKPKTIFTYNGYISARIKPALGAKRLSSLSTHEIQVFYNNLRKSSDSEEGLSPKTIKNIHGIIHRSLRQAVEIGYITFNPSDSCKIPKIRKPVIKPLNEYEIALFLNAIKGKTNETLYVVDLFTGLRQGELLGLTWDCIDFGKGSICIYRQLQKTEGGYEFSTLKNDKTRSITPAPYVMMALKEHKKTQAEWRISAGPLWDKSDFVFSNRLGGHLTHGVVYKNFKRIVKSIGIPETRFHDLRHTYATACIQSGDDIKTIQENLGHYSAAFTLDTYGHVSEIMKKESAERMERYIKSIPKL